MPSRAGSVESAGFGSARSLAANSGYAYVDLTTIPITAVQNIDILKDGASTTYGADAVTGVVNFNLYKDYRGAQVTAYYGDRLNVQHLKEDQLRNSSNRTAAVARHLHGGSRPILRQELNLF